MARAVSTIRGKQRFFSRATTWRVRYGGSRAASNIKTAACVGSKRAQRRRRGLAVSSRIMTGAAPGAGIDANVFARHTALATRVHIGALNSRRQNKRTRSPAAAPVRLSNAAATTHLFTKRFRHAARHRTSYLRCAALRASRLHGLPAALRAHRAGNTAYHTLSTLAHHPFNGTINIIALPPQISRRRGVRARSYRRGGRRQRQERLKRNFMHTYNTSCTPGPQQ